MVLRFLIPLISFSLLFLIWFPYILHTDSYLQCLLKCKEDKTLYFIEKYKIELKEDQLKYGQPLFKANTETYYRLYSKRFPNMKYRCDFRQKNSSTCYHNGEEFPSKDCICGSTIYEDGILATYIILMLGFSSLFYIITGDLPTF